MWDFGIFNNFQKFQVCGNIISAQISQKKNDRLKSADFGTLIYERTHILPGSYLEGLYSNISADMMLYL